MITWDRLKRRKIVQLALAYLAGAWAVLEVISFVGGRFGWPPLVDRVLIVLATFGLPLTVVFAWYHGEKGRQRTSGTELLIVAALLVLAGVGVRLVWEDPGGRDTLREAAPPERSIAVLPLDNLSPAGEHAFFAEAMTEEITSALSEIPDLTVKSRNSASRFTGSGMTVAEFARTIGVAHVIEGSVQRSADEVRLTVQLIDARTDEHVWTETYDRTLTDLFDLQVELAREVADRLAGTFTERERDRILAAATDDPLAYDLYLQAGAGSADADRQVRLLRRAVERDPAFWPAWERLAFAYLAREQQGEGARWADSSHAALRRAIRTADQSFTELRLTAYEALVFGGDEDEAIARLRAAVEERPGDLALVTALARLYRIRGRLPEAERWLRHAALLDPLQSGRWRELFPVYWWVGLYDRAERVLERSLAIDPGVGSAWHQFVWLRMVQNRTAGALTAADSLEALGDPTAALERGFALWWAGDWDAAVAAYSEYDTSRHPESVEWQIVPMAHAFLAAGDSAESRAIADALRAVLEARVVEDYEPEWRVFPRLQLAAFEGDTPRAVELFDAYVARGGRDPTWFEQSPVFSELREEPAFLSALEDLRRLVDEMSREIARRPAFASVASVP